MKKLIANILRTIADALDKPALTSRPPQVPNPNVERPRPRKDYPTF